MEIMGVVYAMIGIGLAVILSGIGSSIGVSRASQAAAGVVAEDPDKFMKCLLLTLLPATQGIYGFIVGFMGLIKIQALAGFMMPATGSYISVGGGLGIMAACIPIAVGGLASAIYQGNVAVASIGLVAKKPEESGKGMLMTTMVETYALLSFLVSFLAVFIPNWV